MKDKRAESEPAKVPEAARQAGELRDRWSWSEPSVWTDRMLAALERGVEGGKWFSLMDKVYSEANLRSSFARVKENGGSGGVDRQSVGRYEARLETNLSRLRESLKSGTYTPSSVRRVWIPKPGSEEKRPLGIPTVHDRVAQTALRNVLEPIFENEFAPTSFGFRPGLSCKKALSRVFRLLASGHTWVVDADLKSYFDTIPHDRLMELIETKVSDGGVLRVIASYLEQKVMDGLRTWSPEQGTPQGAVISPLLANIYLNPLDHQMMGKGYEMTRYADDFVVQCGSEEEAHDALNEIRRWVESAGLTLHPEKTRIVDATQKGGFDFLGYHFERGQQWPRQKSMKKLKDSIRSKTPRLNGKSMPDIVDEVNKTLRGWYQYFKASTASTFKGIDGWVRNRLRSILRKRSHRRGRATGWDNRKYPIRIFTEYGLFSMVTASARKCQSRWWVNH